MTHMTGTCLRTHAHTHTHIHTHIHTHTHTHTLSHTHIYTDIHTQTHTHTLLHTLLWTRFAAFYGAGKGLCRSAGRRVPSSSPAAHQRVGLHDSNHGCSPSHGALVCTCLSNDIWRVDVNGVACVLSFPAVQAKGHTLQSIRLK